MISEENAREKILQSVRALPPRLVPLEKARGFFAAKNLRACVPLPSFDNSAMDGYAVVAADCKIGARLRVIGEQPAGLAQPWRVGRGEALRIFTGATMPEGADAIVMQEEVSRSADEIALHAEVSRGDFVRKRGSDLTEGQNILAAGDRLRAETLALLAAQGFAEVEIGGAARAAIVSTGDELIRPGAQIQPGQIYESNATLLRALLEENFVDVASSRHAVDRPQELKAVLEEGLQQDAVIITGGVSVGDRDHVRPVLRELGAEIDLWRVAIKPGKPFLFGRAKRCLIFGLPGNPVSAFVTFFAFVRPALLKLMGANEESLQAPTTFARLFCDVENEGDRPHYLRGKLHDGVFTPIGRQESHALFGLSRSNALLRVPAGEKIAAHAVVTLLSRV